MNLEQIENEIIRISNEPEVTNLGFRIFSRVERILHAVNVNLREKISLPTSSETPESNSESLQDKFALGIGNLTGLNTYIEIGSGDPMLGNNTYQLEKLGWKGFSIELDPELVNSFTKLRNNPVYCADGTLFEYFEKINTLGLGLNIGYLQIDIDPSVQSLLTLLKVPFRSHKFAAITFEHDSYRSLTKIRNLQRDYLQAFGYVLIAANVKVNRLFAYEDWWVHPDLVTVSALKNFQSKRKHPSEMNWESSNL